MSEIDRDQGHSRGLRALPQIQRLLESAEAERLISAYSRAQATAVLRAVLQRARASLKVDPARAPTSGELLARAEAALASAQLPTLRRTINATGVVLHTNLGRAPLAAEAIAAVGEVARGYSNLEFDLESGARGARTQGVEPLLCELTGAEAALAVNNAAAAVLLALSAIAKGGEVIVSRGELVEIGGGFRIPEVIAQGGARLVEVGTTNKTRLADYRSAITADTRMLLKVHPSNYRVIGFTEEASLEALSALARERGLVLMHDLGSGALIDLRRFGSQPEPLVRDALIAGADLVAFSGDKLLGGPQAGVLVGRGHAVDPLRRHPLLRALRLDKLTLAALEATLRLYRNPQGAAHRIPVLRMLSQGEEALQARAEALADHLGGGADVRIEVTEAYAGGGALPQAALASRAVTVGSPSIGADELARRLRAGRPAIISRIAGGRLVLDLLTVADEEVAELACAIRNAAGP